MFTTAIFVQNCTLKVKSLLLHIFFYLGQTTFLMPWLHVQLLNTIILRSAGRSCHSVCHGCELSWTVQPSTRPHSNRPIRKCLVPKRTLIFHSSINIFTSLSDSLLNDIVILTNVNCNLNVNIITSQYVNTSTTGTSRDSAQRCHWLQHFCLTNIFHYAWKASNNCKQKLHRVACNNCT